jgi:ferrous iron transport protein B
MDRVMHIFGLHGKSFIPMIMGFGCNVPAIMATRMLENKRDRVLTMMIIPFMSCSARLPVYILIAGAVFPQQAGNVIFLMYLIGILFSILMALLLKSTLFKKSEAPFVMELPPYRMPGLRMVLKHMWFKGALYLKKMGGIILIASVIIWALGYFPRHVDLSRDYDQLIGWEEMKIEKLQTSEFLNLMTSPSEIDSHAANISDLKIAKANEQQAGSYIGILGRTIEPLIRPLGFDWKMGVSLIAGFAAKEVVVSTMGVLYQVSDSEDNTVSLQQKISKQVYTEGKKKGQKVYTPLAGFSFLIFVLLYLPCISVITVVGKESGSWKWPALIVFYTTFLAWFSSFCIYQIGSLF